MKNPIELGEALGKMFWNQKFIGISGARICTFAAVALFLRLGLSGAARHRTWRRAHRAWAWGLFNPMRLFVRLFQIAGCIIFPLLAMGRVLPHYVLDLRPLFSVIRHHSKPKSLESVRAVDKAPPWIIPGALD